MQAPRRRRRASFPRPPWFRTGIPDIMAASLDAASATRTRHREPRRSAAVARAGHQRRQLSLAAAGAAPAGHRRDDRSRRGRAGAADDARSTRVARALKTVTACDKLNIAALGNVVPQLHVHVIARLRDRCGLAEAGLGRGAAARLRARRLEQFRHAAAAENLARKPKLPLTRGRCRATFAALPEFTHAAIPDLGPKPLLGYTASILTRAAERRTDDGVPRGMRGATNAAAPYAIGGELVVMKKSRERRRSAVHARRSARARADGPRRVFLGLVGEARPLRHRARSAKPPRR